MNYTVLFSNTNGNYILDHQFIMAHAQVKPQEKDGLIIEEEGGVFQRTIQQISPSTQDKRKRDEETSVGSSSKYRHTSDGNRSATTMIEQDSLSVPFWKHLNNRQSSIHFNTNEIGCFSLLTRGDEKECFEDNRYLRGKYSFIFIKII